MKRLYKLMAKAGICNAFLNLYGQDGVFDYHRDQFLSLNSNCMPKLDAAMNKNIRFCHKAAPGKISFEMCKGHKPMCKFITKCYGMGLEGRGVAMMVRHKAERGPDVDGWDLTLVIDCTKEKHERLQELLLDQERELSRREPSLLCLRLKLAKQGCFHPRDVLPKQSTASAGFRMWPPGRWVNG
jgi:hypothetical protein